MLLGLIPVLKKALTTSHEKRRTRLAVLCYERAVHVCGESFDRKWGCGCVPYVFLVYAHSLMSPLDNIFRYRNFLMACTALMDQRSQETYFSLIDSKYPPGVRNLQALIEEAWKRGVSFSCLQSKCLITSYEGYDEEGAQEFNHKLRGTDKWIGTSGMYVDGHVPFLL
jgi:hypothetical protein